MGKLRDSMVRDLELRGVTETTKQAYLRAATKFAAHFMRSPEEMGTKEVKLFLATLDERGLSRSSVSVYLAGLTFLYRVTLNRPDVVAEIPRPKKTKRKPRVLKGSEVGRLINAMPSLKHRTISMTMYAAGLRISEVCALEVTDIDSARNRILIRQGKGQKDRYVPLSSKLLAGLRRYWRHEQPQRPLMFPGQWNLRPICRSTVNRVFRLVSERIDLKPPATPHHLRHAFATHMLELGTDLRVLQILLGHADPKSTEHYVTLSDQVLGSLKSPFDLLGTNHGRILG